MIFYIFLPLLSICLRYSGNQFSGTFTSGQTGGDLHEKNCTVKNPSTKMVPQKISTYTCNLVKLEGICKNRIAKHFSVKNPLKNLLINIYNSCTL